MEKDELQRVLEKHRYSHCLIQTIDTKKITSELLDVLSRHDLAVADAIDILELAKHKILVQTKVKPGNQNLINVKKAVQDIMLDCLSTPNDELSKVLRVEKK